MSEAKYHIGDTVRIVEEPYDSCPFDWISAMDEYCGMSAIITDARYVQWANTWAYTIDIDESDCSWCEGCFVGLEGSPELEESDTDIESLFV